MRISADLKCGWGERAEFAYVKVMAPYVRASIKAPTIAMKVRAPTVEVLVA
jgi:hypothetical protein